MKTHVHLIGCNGVPSRVYTPILNKLEKLGVESTGYSNIHSFPNVKNWKACSLRILKDAQEAQNKLGTNCRLIGFGHSLGGALIYGGAVLSKQNKTKNFDKIIIYEPPMMSPIKRIAMLLMGLTKTFKYFPPVKASLRKPSSFPNFQQTEMFIKNKWFYQQFHPIMLDSFLSNAFVETNEGRIAFDFKPQQEADIIMSSPLELFSFLNNGGNDKHFYQYSKAGCDGTLFYSTKHDFATPSDIEYLKNIIHGPSGQFKFKSHEGGHYAPLIEDPGRFADLIFKEIQM